MIATAPCLGQRDALERLCQDIQNHCTQDENGEALLPNGRSAGICTFSARLITELRGGEVFGYNDSDLPTNFIGEGEGHDFALIQDRYLIDWWNCYFTGEAKRCVYDLQDPEDAEISRGLYPPRDRWNLVPAPPMITQHL